MKLQILVKANSRQPKVEKLGENMLRVFVKAPAKEGRANREVVALLAEYFSRPKSDISIFMGAKSRQKWVKVGESS